MFMIYYDEIPVGTIALYNIDFENNIAEFGRLLIGNTTMIVNRGIGASSSGLRVFNKPEISVITLKRE